MQEAPPLKIVKVPVDDGAANNLGNMSLIAVTAGFLAFKFAIPAAPMGPVVHEGFVRFFEAGMVGGLADWFAVTALFRYPLGLPIPHTNLLLKNRPKIQAGIGAMVQHLLSPAKIREHLERASLAELVQNTLRNGTFRSYLKDKMRDVGVVVATQLANGKARHDFIDNVNHYLEEEIEYADHIGHMLRDAHQRGMVDSIAEYASKRLLELMDEHADAIVEYLYKQLDPNVFQKIFINRDALREQLPRIRQELINIGFDTKHPARQKLRQAVEDYSIRLNGDPKTQAEVKAWTLRLFEDMKLTGKLNQFTDQSVNTLVRDLEGRNSRALSVIDDALEQIVASLDNEVNRRNLDKQLKEILFSLLDDKQIAKLAQIAEKAMAEKKPDEFVEFVESKVRNDLQYVRVNGAIVGGLVGLFLYIVSLWPH